MTAHVELKSQIDGQWTDGTGDEVRSTNPARPGETVALGRGLAIDAVDRAVAAARAAQRDWAATPAHERGAVLLRAAEFLTRDAEAIGTELSREEGKTRVEGVGEVHRAAQILRFFAAVGDRQAGELYHSPRAGEQIQVVRRPLGVVGAITPFNFPIAIPAWKIAPALAYGNTVVWKPASAVPLLAMRLTSALVEAGLPSGVLNLVLGSHRLGSALVSHPGIDGLTFTGSTAIGTRIGVELAGRGVSYQAEMGGKNAALVFDDADLDLAAENIALGAFRSSGQKCTATSRLLVTESVADELLDRLRVLADDITVGDPLDESVTMGPVIDAGSRTRLQDAFSAAVQRGARVIAAPQLNLSEELSDGHFVAPSILELHEDDDEILRAELFGPLLAVRRVPSNGDAVRLANDSEYALSAAVFTEDLGSALGVIDELRVGVLHVNSESAGADPHVPFGGNLRSGLGPKEQGIASREFFTESTTVYLRSARAR